ncbi:response regulator [Roseofilum capinflatum]|uniref:histidine kinase n=1 Tax=Roseofilum capinflatum BLCC-M114 TaxID=3022440 RepID=A0ABT7B383_9CYAN|nr:response regulator [Roseofilum capinflatum]MDJ1173272.1 response regulator [Roseofilum capinflatum BLCC-M114]
MTTQHLSPPKPDILVVDDTPENLRLLVKILRENAYKVRPVPNGNLALSAIEASPPDLILLDIMMPGINGYELCEKLKSNPKTQSIPIVFITAMNEVFDKVKGFHLGAVDYITKPFEIDEVLVRVKTHLDNNFLQTQLQEKNQELEFTLEQLKLTQSQLIQSEKMAALGQLIAGVAHEINTPLGAIRASVDNLTDFFHRTLEEFPEFFETITEEQKKFFYKLSNQIDQSNEHISSREKRKYRRALVRQLEDNEVEQADAIADTLVDIGIYNQIDNIIPELAKPENTKVLNMAYQISSIQKSVKTVSTATSQAAKVVFALKCYARHDLQNNKELTKITSGLETVLTLYQNKFKKGVDVLRNYQDTPPIWCYPDELNQVWTNLIHNALQAMNYEGTLKIDVVLKSDHIQVKITDTGSGISPEVRPRIFDAFFTTKAPGEGSGLGLDIVKKIIDKHEGKIEVNSVPGNTEFIISLPLSNQEVDSHA